jgi:hypothetical protein
MSSGSSSAPAYSASSRVFGAAPRGWRAPRRSDRGVPVRDAQAAIMAVGKIGIDLDPLPALGRDLVGDALQLVGDQPVEQRDVLQPAAVVV